MRPHSQTESARPGHGRTPAPGTIRAIIDIGTVSVRLLVAQVAPQGIRPLAKQARIANLGEGVFETGLLAQEAIDRVVGIVDDYIGVMRQMGMVIDAGNLQRGHAVAMATSAARDAHNSDVLVEALRERGVPLWVVPGQLEARLSFAGASMGHLGAGILVSDIGGGSTELIVGQVRDAAGQAAIQRAKSHDVGCRRVTELFLHDDPPTQAQIQRADDWCRQQLAPFFTPADVRQMIAVAGTATSLVSMWDRMEAYDSERVHGRVMHRVQVDELLGRLAGMNLAQRQQVVGLQPQRAAVIVAGLLILRDVLELAGLCDFTVSENDNLMGFIALQATGQLAL